MSERARQAQREAIRQRRTRERHEKLFQQKQTDAQVKAEEEARESVWHLVEEEIEPYTCAFCGDKSCFWFGELIDHIIACPKARHLLPLGAGFESIRGAAKILAANLVDSVRKSKG